MDIIDSFTIGQTNFGANINYAPSVNKWVKLSAGTFSNFLITFCDQNLNLIQALDNNILITLLFKFPSPKLLKNEKKYLIFIIENVKTTANLKFCYETKKIL